MDFIIKTNAITNIMINKFITGFLVIAIFSSIQSSAQVVLPFNSDWKYFKGTQNPSSNMKDWILDGFDDSSWATGNAPFRYGDGTGGTELTDMAGVYTSLFIRKELDITIPDSVIDKAVFSFNYDDGFKVFINGTEVLNRFAPTVDDYTAVSTDLHESGIAETAILTKNDHLLHNGVNQIAIAAYNTNSASSDFYIDLRIEIIPKAPAKPKGPEVLFSTQGGTYSSPFDLVLSSAKAGDTIQYTLDCSDPSKPGNAKSGVSPLTVHIDPGSTEGRPLTPSVIVRAAVIKYNTDPSIETRSYIFLENVKTQVYPGGDWPDSQVNGQVFDYEIDSRVVNDTRYKGIFTSAMNSIPTVSLVTDNKYLFSQDSGIYVNAYNHGELWERPASIELINTDNTEDFSSNVGVRIRGGYSRSPDNPKHAFRIFFNNSYGKKTLKFPLFGADAAQEFKKIDLRCAQNYSWSFAADNMYTNAQDEFCRDAQGIMGHPYTRSRYCHLYLNGMYWGLYEFMERPEANFASSYVGGDKDNFDVIKIATDNGYNIEATDGNLDGWQKLYNLINLDLSIKTNYYKVLGMNERGNIDTTIEKMVDLDNLIDYMINIFYSGNFDSPISEFGGNNMPNNIYCIKNRNQTREGFFFVVHDAEHTLNYIAGSQEPQNEGVNENRVDLIHDGMSKPAFQKFNPMWVHYQLSKNPEYCQRFSDRAYKYLYNDGVFTPAVAEQVFRNRTKQIEMAVIGESARWGDSRWGNLKTKDDTWVPAVNNTVNRFIKLRTPIVINQLKAASLLSDVAAVTIKKDNTEIKKNLIEISGATSVTLASTISSAKIYYTLDGTDPRITGGSVNTKATEISSGSEVSIPYPIVLKCRVKDANDWSPLREVIFTNKLNRDKIRITEIQYNPVGLNAANPKDMEFIELKNTGEVGVDIGGCKLDSAVNYKFPVGTIILPKGFVVIASDLNDFEYVYYRRATGQFTGNLSNEGERIMLVDESDNVLIDMKYEIDYPWPIIANGSGYSLVAKTSNPNNMPNTDEYWKGSKLKFGSPFSDDSSYVAPDPDPDVIKGTNVLCSVYPNPVSESLYIETRGQHVKSLQLYDMNGRIVYTNNKLSSAYVLTVPVANLHINQGIYVLKVQTSKGIENIKIVINK